MRLAPFATEADVDEALRLFQVSTLDAASNGNLAGACADESQSVNWWFQRSFSCTLTFTVHCVLRPCDYVCLFSGAEGFTTEEDQEMLARIEKQIKRRFVTGSQVSEHAIIQDFLKQVRARRLVMSLMCFVSG